MGAVVLLLRSGARQRAAELIVLAVVVAVGAGTAIAALSLAWHTDHAYPEYLGRAEVGELVVNPSIVTDRVREIIVSSPGVVNAASDTLFSATPDDGRPRSGKEIQGNPVQVRSSPDGRYSRRDRPAVHQGRTLGGAGEAFLNREAAALLGVAVGDEIPVAFWQVTPRGVGADPTEIVSPIGRVAARVVGIGAFSDEALPEEIYPRSRVVLSPDLTAPFDCSTSHPAADDTLTLEQLTASFFPEGCARDPQYFSLRLAGGDRDAAVVAAQIAERLEGQNQMLPKVMRDLELGFSVIPTITRDERTRVQRSLAPSVTALQLFGLLASISTVTVAGLAALRSGRRLGLEARVWSDLGITRRQTCLVAGIPLALAAVVGLAGALVAAWLASGVGPVSIAEALESQASRALPPLPVTAKAIPLALLVLGLEISIVSWLASARRHTPTEPTPSRLAQLAFRRGSVPLALGARAALPGTTRPGVGAGALLLGATGVVLAVVGSIVFSANIDSLVRTPARFGWTFDAAAVIGYGYGGADESAIARSLDRDEVEHWGLAALPGEVAVNGESLPGLAGMRGFDSFPLPVVAGRIPTEKGEIALGARSAERLGLTIGDTVQIGTQFGGAEAKVTGLVVLPSIGPFLSDRVGLGTGVLLSREMLEALVADAERAKDVPAGTLAGNLGTFVVLDLADGVEAAKVLADLEDESATWDVNGTRIFAFYDAIRPPEIADVAAMRAVPSFLAALLAGSMAVALALAIALTTRSRRRQLAIIRALGATPRQLRATVRWHALTVVALGLVGGTVLGISLGSTTWRAFSERLDIVPSVALPWRWILASTAAALLIALLAAELPARLAPRRAAIDPLRQE
ncbi:MAG: FtsX-like permease family protein [Acidimicrobiales bacterium]